MSMVRFATICDHCKARSPEYSSFPSCRECMDDVCPGCSANIDEETGRADLNGLFFRADSVTHSAGEYARGPVSTNSIESVWAVLKRGIYGVYHQVSAKHLDRYVQEFAFRLNQGNVARHTLERLDSFVDAIKGKRLTYARLTA